MQEPTSSSSIPTQECESISQENINYDVAFYRQKAKGMKTSQIQDLIKNIFKPGKSFLFPKTNKRSFRFEWLEQFPLLQYSQSLDGAFCLPCVLFGDQFPTKNGKIKKLFTEPRKYWADAVANFKRHNDANSCGLHRDTYAIYLSHLKIMSGENQPIDVMVDTNLRKQISENRKKLIPIVDTIRLCGRLGLPLRGHRDDSQYHPEVGEYSTGGVGNFVELLNFRVRSGDTDLREHLSKCKKNASYISKTAQNDIINCCGELITEQIIEDLKHHRFYSILADEAADCSNKEQMSLVLRFVDKDYNIREDFVRFIHCKLGLTGKDLSTVLLKCITDDLKLNIEDCRGQGYDGAGAVAGRINGLSSHILRLNKLALYTHCVSHRLNLVVASSCSAQCVKNVMAQIKELSYFFNLSQNRQLILEDNVSRVCPDFGKKKLLDVCRTRWIE